MTIKLFLVTLALCISGCATPAERAAHKEGQTKAARVWCDRMGIRVTGVECNDDDIECYVAPEGGSPFRLYCNHERCWLPSPPSR